MLPIRTDRATRERYSQGAGIYRIVPAAVARPADVAALARVLDWAAREGVSVVPRGAGSAMDGGNVGEGLVLDLTGLAVREPVVDSASATIAADAGVALSRVEAAAAGQGLRFGPDPSSAAWATVGGVIATNAAGARSYRLGAVDRWVEAIECVTADGPLTLARGRPADSGHPGVQRFERDAAPLLRAHRAAVLARLPATTKDTAGYGLRRYYRHGELLDLMIGSEGTLGVITGATLRLEAIPPARATLQMALPDRVVIVPVVEALAPADPTAVELFDRSFLALVDGRATELQGAAAVLLVELEAPTERELVERIGLASAAVEGLVERIVVGRTPAESAAIWSLRHRASPMLAGLTDGRRSLQVIEDGCVPLPSLPAYLDVVEHAARAAGIDAVMFGHAGDGHVHVNLLPNLERPDWLEAVRTILDTVTEALLGLGGTPAGEHGAGRLRAPLLPRVVGSEAMACMVAVKRALDPEGRFNPGVIVGGGEDPLVRLKVGRDAEPIAPMIAEGLRRIEAERGWGESRWDGGPG